jgi:alpha-L-fucosidase
MLAAALLGSVTLLLGIPTLRGGYSEPPPVARLGEPGHPSLASCIEVDGHPLAVPTPQQAAWQDLELGMFIHMAPQTWQDKETDDLSTPASAMNPEKLDTDQWVRVAESMGARYIVFVAKHEGGFCWWPTATTDYSVKSSPWRAGKGDVLKDLAASCKQRGMKLGVYLSPQDRTHKVGVGGKADDPTKQAEYEKLFRTQLEEVLSNYGEMVEVWFDGSLVFDVGDILAKHAPNAMVFQGPQATIKWVGNEDGVAPAAAWTTVKSGARKWGDYTARDGDPSGDRWLPNECDARMRYTWFWRTDNAKTVKSVAQLMDMYERSVGRGGVLLLNNTPDRSGLIPAADAARAAEFGAEIARVYGPGSAIASTSGKRSESTQIGLALPHPAVIDRAVIMEDITQGERVRSFQFGAMVRGEWTPLAAGTFVGHKAILKFDPVKVEAVQLRVTDAVGKAMIRSFSVHRASNDPASAKEPTP